MNEEETSRRDAETQSVKHSVSYKFRPGDDVYFLRDSKIYLRSVLNIVIRIYGEAVDVIYEVPINKTDSLTGKQRTETIYEQEAFRSVDELTKALGASIINTLN